MLDSCCDSSTIDAVVALSDALLLVSVIVAICFLVNIIVSMVITLFLFCCDF